MGQLGVRYKAVAEEEVGDWSFPVVVDVCRVDAGGVPAEWVEATVATAGQPTYVLFSDGRSGIEALTAGRELAREIAIATGARVLSIGCRSATVDDGVTAYGWLLGEGLDLHTTCFVIDPAGGGLASAVTAAAKARGLPVPPL